MHIAAAILSALLIYQFAVAYGLKTPAIRGFENAAKFITNNPKGNSVLLISYFDGNLIFHIRKNDKSGNLLVLRDEKVLPSSYRFKGINNDIYQILEKDLYQILENYGTKYIIVEESLNNKNPSFKFLMKILQNGNFTLQKKIKLEELFVRKFLKHKELYVRR